MRRRAGVTAVIMAVLAVGATASLGATVREVRVPRTAGSLLATYARVRTTGLRVNLAGPWTFNAAVSVARVTPRAGARIPVGSAVTLSLTPPSRAASFPPSRRLRVPSFLSQSAEAAYGWALRHGLAFTARLGSLRDGKALQLLANFVVTGQRPAPGRWATTLIVWGRQPAPRPHPAPHPAPPVGPPPAASAGPPRAPTSSSSPAPAPAADPSSSPPVTTPAGNPVYSAAAAFPDPFVLDVGDTHSDYWAFATGDLFPILHSADLVHWTAEGTAMTSRPSWVLATGDWHPWSPSLIETSQPCPGASAPGCYLMYYVGLSAAYNRNCVAVATSSTPGGPYTDQGPLALAGAPGGDTTMPIGCGDANGVGNIDPSAFVDTSGQAYLYVSTDNSCTDGSSCTLKPTISVIPLSSDLLEASGARRPLISGDAGTWEAADVAAPTVEGPSIELHDGTYYLFYSGGSYMHAYGMGYATSTGPTGPFVKASTNPFFASTANAFSVGGGDRLVTGPHGGLWMVYAARTSPSVGENRTLWIDPFSWAPASTPGAPDVPVVAGPTTAAQVSAP